VSEASEPRKIGPVLATGLVAGNMIGSGVFLLPATLGAIGGVSLIGWLASTAAAFATAAVFANLGRISASLDGLVGYAGEGLGRFFGFSTAVIYWMAAWVGVVAMGVAAAGYFVVFTPGLAHPLPLALIAMATIWLFTLLNLVGARAVTRFSSLSLVAGLAPILGVAILGWIWFDPKVFAASWNVSGHSAFDAVKVSMISTFWAYTGFESAAVASAVVRDPQRNVPIGLYLGSFWSPPSGTRRPTHGAKRAGLRCTPRTEAIECASKVSPTSRFSFPTTATSALSRPTTWTARR